MTKLNGCHNHRPFVEKVMVQAGWFMDGQTRIAKMKMIKNPMSKGQCKYDLRETDTRCAGCAWIKVPEE